MYEVLSAQGHKVRIFDANLGEGDRLPLFFWRSLPRQFRRMKLKKRLPRLERSAAGPLHVWPATGVSTFLKDSTDVLIYHFAMGWQTGLDLLQNTSYRRVVKWHNITPAHFFTNYSWEYEAVCEEGRQQLATIANLGCDLYLSGSEYNAAEFLAAGAPNERSAVVPPFTHTEQVSSMDADLQSFGYCDGKVNLLTVGRLSPNKGHELLIDAFDIYHREFNPDSRLLILGKDLEKLESYSALLNEKVKQLQLGAAVVFTGEVSEAELKTYYLISDLLVLASEHEGFCVPLIEAMSRKLPIIACESSAVPSTLGEAGVLLKDRNSRSLATAIDKLIRNERQRFELAQHGRVRYEQLFTRNAIKARFLNAVRPVLPGSISV